jgi:hypothetical protein
MNLVATDFLKNGIIYIKIGTVYLKFGEKIEISRSDFFKLDRRRNLYSNFFCVFLPDFILFFYNPILWGWYEQRRERWSEERLWLSSGRRGSLLGLFAESTVYLLYPHPQLTRKLC